MAATSERPVYQVATFFDPTTMAAWLNERNAAGWGLAQMATAVASNKQAWYTCVVRLKVEPDAHQLVQTAARVLAMESTLNELRTRVEALEARSAHCIDRMNHLDELAETLADRIDTFREDLTDNLAVKQHWLDNQEGSLRDLTARLDNLGASIQQLDEWAHPDHRALLETCERLARDIRSAHTRLDELQEQLATRDEKVTSQIKALRRKLGECG